MAAHDTHTLAFVFGILGTVVSFLVLLAPLSTFYRIYKRKSADGFQSLPYSVALFSAMLMFYYAYIKKNSPLLLGINSFGSIIETIYLIVYMIYAPSRYRIFTAKLIVLFNILAYGVIVVITYQIPNHDLQLKVIGWINVVFSICVFAAPLSILRLVVRTKSVEYMSLPLSICLTLCAVMWFFYGLLIKDLFVAAPNILGFSFGMAQMILFLLYSNTTRPMLPEFKLNEMPNRVAAANDEIIVSCEGTIQTEMKTGEGENKTSSEAGDDRENHSQTTETSTTTIDTETSPESIV
ncbi:bidirectional sugar transporter SWEET9-like [Argentina anserina]|uniref:bidirectional sugar transporter SWEET9-like n=1 Tax=Argentina anserina TaxID=57926 RepID=UPI0021763A48|nr:bidirectional sugar transporter SWEET9-like [Potentilla anserina]